MLPTRSDTICGTVDAFYSRKMDAEQSQLTAQWTLNPNVMYLDHGAFGGCPIRVMKTQEEIRRAIEADPHDFFERRYPTAIEGAKTALAKFVNADARGLVLMTGTTQAVNVVVQSQKFGLGDEILTTSHMYSSVAMLLDFMAARDGAKVVVAEVPFPIRTKEEIAQSIMSCVTDRTKFALIDHTPSRTGLVFPVEEIVAALAVRGIDTLVDGAHVPGMIPLDVSKINAAYYVGNCHKWMCTPRGVGFIHIRADRINRIKPLVIARSPHAANPTAHGTLEHQFDWQGTFDPSAWLSLPATINFLESVVAGGHAGLVTRNKGLAIEAGRLICNRLGIEFPCDEELVTSMVSIPLPDSLGPPSVGILPIQLTLWERHQIEVPIYAWPAHPKRVLRISCQAYNFIQQYASFADILHSYLQQETASPSLPSPFVQSPMFNNSCRPICRDSHVRKPVCNKLVRLPSRRKQRPDIESPGHVDLFRLAKARVVDILRNDKSDPPPILYPLAERIQETYFPLDAWLEIGNMELEISRLTYTLTEYRARQMPTFCEERIKRLLLSSVLDNWSVIVDELKLDARNAYNNLVSTVMNSGPSQVDTFCRSPIPYSTTRDVALQLWKKSLAEFGEQLQNLSFGHVRQFLEIHAFLKDPFTGLFNDFDRQTMIFNSLWVEVEKEISGALPSFTWQATAAQLALESSYLAIRNLERVTYVHFRGHQQLTYVYVKLDSLRRVEFSLPSRVAEVIKEIIQFHDGKVCTIAPITISCVISPRTQETYKVVVDGNNRVVALTTLRFLASKESLEVYASKHNHDLKLQTEIRDVLYELDKLRFLQQILGKSDVLESFAKVERIPALVVQEQSFHTAWIEDTAGDMARCMLLQPVQQVVFSERGRNFALPAKHQSHGRPLGFKAMPLL